MAGYQTLEALRPILHRGPPQMPVVNRALVRPDEPFRAVHRAGGVPDATKAKIVEMRENGASYREIRIACRVSCNTIQRYAGHIVPPNGLARCGWHSGAQVAVSKYEKGAAKAKRMHRAGFSYREIADELGCHYSSAYYIINPRSPRKDERKCKMIKRVAAVTGVGGRDLRKSKDASYRGSGDVSRARHLLFWLIRRYQSDLSLAAIGKRYGGFNHGTVHAGIIRADAVAQSIGLPSNIRPLAAARRMWAAEWPASA